MRCLKNPRWVSVVTKTVCLGDKRPVRDNIGGVIKAPRKGDNSEGLNMDDQYRTLLKLLDAQHPPGESHPEL